MEDTFISIMDTEYLRMIRLFQDLELDMVAYNCKLIVYDGNGFDVEFYFSEEGKYTNMKVVEL